MQSAEVAKQSALESAETVATAVHYVPQHLQAAVAA